MSERHVMIGGRGHGKTIHQAHLRKQMIAQWFRDNPEATEIRIGNVDPRTGESFTEIMERPS